jgi:poly(hydroxyalkanoate) granule-associated protein
VAPPTRRGIARTLQYRHRRAATAANPVSRGDTPWSRNCTNPVRRLSDHVPHLTGSVKDSAQQIWQAGLGAFAKAQAEGTRAFEALVKEGTALQRKTQAAAEERITEATNRMSQHGHRHLVQGHRPLGQAGEHLRRTRRQGLNKLGVPSAKDISALIARIDELKLSVQKLSGEQPAQAKVAASPRPSRRQGGTGEAAARRRRPRQPQEGREDHRAAPRPNGKPARPQAAGNLAATQHARQRGSPPRHGQVHRKPPRSRWHWPAAARWVPSTRSAPCARSEESLTGLDLNRLDHYVGVSAGGFIAAGLANGMTARDLCAAFIENDPDSDRGVRPGLADGARHDEFAAAASCGPACWRRPCGAHRRAQIADPRTRTPGLGPAHRRVLQPQIHTELSRRLFSANGRTNDFRKLKTRLDPGGHQPGHRRGRALSAAPGWDHVPISQAVQASSALPGLFPPVEIDDQYYVDGALKKTLHASVAMDQGVDLMLCLNPLVPFDATHPSTPRVMQRGLAPSGAASRASSKAACPRC